MIINTNTKRSFVIHNTDEACTYLKSASAFNSAIYIKKDDKYNLLENTNILQIGEEDNYFIFNHDFGLDLSVNQKCSFRILLEACVVDFTTTIKKSSAKDENRYKFLLPGRMTVQYIRKYLRMKPSKYHPVDIKFIKDRLILKFSVLDISTSGIAVKVPRAEMLYGIGDMIDEMEILLTEKNGVKVAGQIRAVKGDRCGIKFIECMPEAEELIAEYIDRRQLAEKIRAKTYRDVEKELMMLNKKS